MKRREYVRENRAQVPAGGQPPLVDTPPDSEWVDPKTMAPRPDGGVQTGDVLVLKSKGGRPRIHPDRKAYKAAKERDYRAKKKAQEAKP